MTLKGTIQSGAVVLDEPVGLPNGTPVRVDVTPSGPASDEKREIPSLYDRLKDVIGKAEGLPSDLSVNHDHYLYGAPKRT